MTLAKQETNKHQNTTNQTRKPKPKNPNTNTKERRQVSLDGETGGEQAIFELKVRDAL